MAKFSLVISLVFVTDCIVNRAYGAALEEPTPAGFTGLGTITSKMSNLSSVQANRKTIFLSDESTDWSTASYHCSQTLKGYLLSIYDDEELNDVIRLLTFQNAENEEVWTGGRNIGGNIWAWSTPPNILIPPSSDLWMPGEPFSYNNVVLILRASFLTWNLATVGTGDGHKFRYVCEVLN